MKTRFRTLITTLTATAALATGSANAALVADWNASADTPGNLVWKDETGNGNDLTFVSTANGTTADDTDLVGSAYSFPSTGGSANAIGASTSPSGGGNAYFTGLDVMTMDLWFQVDTTSQKAVLFTTGGLGRGTSLSYDNGEIRFLLKGSGSVGADSDINLTGAITADETTQFVRASVTIDGANDDVFLYVDGLQVASSTSTVFGDFTGNNNTSIGTYNITNENQVGGADNSPSNDPTDDHDGWAAGFAGDISRVQVYDSIEAIPEPSSLALMALAGVALFLRRRRRA